MRNVTLHAFNWRYTEIIENLDAIRAAGYGAILIPPPLYSDPKGDQWWQRYQPKDYRVLLSHLGGKRDLENLLEACHSGSSRIQVYADLVINHMANEARADHLNFPGEAELERYKAEPALFAENRLYGDLNEGLFSPWDFNQAGEIEGHEWGDRGTVQSQNLSGLPDLKDSDWVLKQQYLMVEALVEMGFDGFRVDAIKHITEHMIDNLADAPAFHDRFWFGEVLTGSENDEKVFLEPFLRETWMSAYDFPLFQTIREAFGFGGSLRALANPQDQGNALPWNRAVTFVVNHDIPHNDGFRFWLLDPQDEHLAHAYILGRDGGVPLIYSDHNESKHDVDRDRWLDFYKRPDIVAMIAFHNAVQGELMHILYESDVLLVFRRGEQGMVAINKSGTEQRVNLSTWGLKNPGQYRELIQGQTMTLSGNQFSLSVPARSAQMWLLD
ncbi:MULTISPECIES: alpha-amylase family glycosyl hydrolase [Leptolyngbya]|uniref:alpha-amylase family glycosyl hydrolase n=1 Tax=Leptolyngbya TaxID=47251 RepID=UPI00168424EC|nr:alpha-amylase family glycosyl hydrolase [Leptolyngbya sp. FACHB-1624]MBD1855128.1 alpha amylase C-terminal domain-containing protein [Leptolyngbya sp. FACHB-1624]